MKIVSWNVNGIMPCLSNHSIDSLHDLGADLVCFQETRTDKRPTVLHGYYHEWNVSERSGYAGVLSASRHKPLSVQHGFGVDTLDKEGRIAVLEFRDFYSVNAYFPKAQASIARHTYRMAWDSALREMLVELDLLKPVILCGDFNITRGPLDVYPENERQVWAEKGYMSEERDSLEELLENGFTDVFRHLYPELPGAYTWWSNRLNKRKENRGWRLDYFCISDRILPLVKDIRHCTEIYGSDHCPVLLEISL